MEDKYSIKVNTPKLFFTILFPKSIDIARNNFFMKKELLWTSYSKFRPNFSLFYFNYLKPVRSRNISFKKFEILPMSVV